MANRRQKRAKRMRRRQDQVRAAQGVRREAFDDGSVIEELRGPKRNDRSHHKTDPMKHGERLDARGIIDKALRELGGPDVEITDEMRREFSRLAKITGSATAAKSALRATFKKTDAYKTGLVKVAQRQVDQSAHGFSAETVDSCVIECRRLSMEDRSKRLKRSNDIENQARILFHEAGNNILHWESVDDDVREKFRTAAIAELSEVFCG